jgi:ppGpp synthetase/RelA/SpoT-type nucleotidyltranferase
VYSFQLGRSVKQPKATDVVIAQQVGGRQAVADQVENLRTQSTVSLDNYSRRFGGYTAEHRWAILRPKDRHKDKSLHEQPIEIQIRSVLMDSWISINRNIKYDALTGILSAQEQRILDSIKGLAQTGKVLLEQLHYVNTAR